MVASIRQQTAAHRLLVDEAAEVEILGTVAWVLTQRCRQIEKWEILAPRHRSNLHQSGG